MGLTTALTAGGSILRLARAGNGTRRSSSTRGTATPSATKRQYQCSHLQFHWNSWNRHSHRRHRASCRTSHRSTCRASNRHTGTRHARHRHQAPNCGSQHRHQQSRDHQARRCQRHQQPRDHQPRRRQLTPQQPREQRPTPLQLHRCILCRLVAVWRPTGQRSPHRHFRQNCCSSHGRRRRRCRGQYQGNRHHR